MWDLNKKALTLAKPVTDFDCEVMKIICLVFFWNAMLLHAFSQKDINR